jgi:6-phosphogluconate dehydrogenase
MQIGIVGLGRMGGNIARRLMRNGHRCAVFDARPEVVDGLAKEGAIAAHSLEGLLGHLTGSPAIVWVMLPAGEITETAISDLAKGMQHGDILIDGGNTFYRDDIRRAKALVEKGIHYVDVGTSGGVWGLERGYCMMVGGDADAVHHIDPILSTLAPGFGDVPRTKERHSADDRAERGYIHAGPPGSGHFVKMIHNGIEYGLMQAYAEGFEILRNKASEALPPEERLTLDLADIAEVWRRGSVVSSWLLDLTASALAANPDLAPFSGFVQDSGEGRWTLDAAMEEAVPAYVLSAALYSRFRSRQQNSFADKLLSAMRFGFGGHVEEHPQ